MKIHWYTYEVPVRLPTMVRLFSGPRWVVDLRPIHWRRARGDWPSHWAANTPPWPGPIFRYWTLGPIEVWRFRERSESRQA